MIKHVMNARPRDKRKVQIHAVFVGTTTYCAWDYTSRINGSTVRLAVPTTKSVNCLKCITQLRMHLANRVKTLPASVVEKMLNDL